MRAACRKQTKLQRLFAYYGQGGSTEVLRHLSASGYMPHSLFFFSTIQVYALGAANQEALKRVPQGYQFMRADAGVIDELVACQAGYPGTSAQTFARFFEQGQHCFVARRNGVVVAYFWVFAQRYELAFDEPAHRRLTLALKADQRFFGNGFIAPAYRLKGLFPHLVEFVSGQYPAPMRFFSSVNCLNQASLRAHRRFGFAPVLRISCLQAAAMRVFYAQRPAGSPSLLAFRRRQADLDRCLGRVVTAAGCPDAAGEA